MNNPSAVKFHPNVKGKIQSNVSTRNQINLKLSIKAHKIRGKNPKISSDYDITM